MLPFKKFMFPINTPYEYSCIILDDMRKTAAMEYGYRKNGLFEIHLHDYTDSSIFEPIAAVNKVTTIVPEFYIPGGWFQRFKDVMYPVLQVSSIYFPRDFNLYSFPFFKHGRLIYESHNVRRTWSIIWPTFAEFSGVEVTRNQEFRRDKYIINFVLGLDRLEMFE